MSDRADVKILPPVVPVFAMLIGGTIHALNPIEISAWDGLMYSGAILVFISIIIVLVAIREITLAKTAFDVRKPTTNLVTTGIFRFSRNPTYLSMMFLCFGIALIVNSLTLIFASVLTGSGLCLLVIRPEESYLRQKFKDDYNSYAAEVRRWL